MEGGEGRGAAKQTTFRQHRRIDSSLRLIPGVMYVLVFDASVALVRQPKVMAVGFLYPPPPPPNTASSDLTQYIHQ